MSSTFEGQPFIEGFGDAFRQEVSDGYSQALSAVSANAAKKGYKYLVEPLNLLAAGTEYDYLPDRIVRTASLQCLDLVGQFAENPDFSSCRLLSDSYAQDSDEETNILSEIETFVDVLSDSQRGLPFQEHRHLAGFGESYSTVIPEVYVYVSYFLKYESPEDEEAVATVGVRVFRAKNINGRLVRAGGIEAKII